MTPYNPGLGLANDINSSRWVKLRPDTSSHPTQSQQPKCSEYARSCRADSERDEPGISYSSSSIIPIWRCRISIRKRSTPDGTLDQSKLTATQRDPRYPWPSSSLYQNSQEYGTRSEYQPAAVAVGAAEYGNVQSYITPLLGMENPTSSDITPLRLKPSAWDM